MSDEQKLTKYDQIERPESKEKVKIAQKRERRTQKLKTKIAQKIERRTQKLKTKKQNQSHEYQTKREEFNNQDIQIQKKIL